MYRDIILLAESLKYNNLCVAGIDITNGEWIRVMSDDKDIHNAVKVQNMMCVDGTLPEILDIVRIKFKGTKPSFYQPENLIFDKSYTWQKIGEVSIRKLLKIHPTEIRDFIFFDDEKKIHSDFLRRVPEDKRYSLVLVSPRNAIVHVKEWPERKDVTMSFEYNGEQYRFMSITDIDFKNSYLKRDDGNYSLGNNVLLVISLGEVHTDNHHYKLVTTVIG